MPYCPGRLVRVAVDDTRLRKTGRAINRENCGGRLTQASTRAGKADGQVGLGIQRTAIPVVSFGSGMAILAMTSHGQDARATTEQCREPKRGGVAPAGAGW